MDNELWEIGLSHKYHPDCRISTRTSPKIARKFNRLNGVEKFFRKIGVTEFKVVLLKKH